MSEQPVTTPEPVTPDPAPAHEGFGAHIRDWFEADVEPRVTAIEGDVVNLKAFFPQLASFATSLVAAVKAVAPNAAPEVAAVIADAEAVAAEIARIAAELGVVGV